MAQKIQKYCQICNKWFAQAHNFKLHMRAHSGEKPFQCSVPPCRKTFVSKNAQQCHERTHFHVKRFKCDLCPQRFVSESNRKTHLKRTHAPDRVKNVKCDSCDSQFYDKYALKNHIIRVHKKNENLIEKCPFCPKAFHAKCFLYDHIRYHTWEKPYFCKICSREFAARNNVTSHEKTHNQNRERRFECNQCGDKFFDKIVLVRHSRCHSEKRLFKCNVCGKSLKTPENLKKHIQNVHRPRKPFPCQICGKSFSSNGNRKLHEKNIHVRQRKLHKCSICKKTYSHKHGLKHHQKLHQMPADQLPFECIFCKRRYLNIAAFTWHIFWHIQERPYFCNVCSNEYPTSSLLKDHLDDHKAARGNAYHCKSCSKTFVRKSCLLRHHQRLHSERKQYSCELCNESFLTQNKLFSHMRNHLGEEPFQCENCNKTFKTESGRLWHRQRGTCASIQSVRSD